VFATFRGILGDHWRWRRQIWHLALLDLKKTYRGAVLGWIWLFVQPLAYIGVFWFAIDLGLRAGQTAGDYPFIFWLAAGLIPWFFMQSMIGTGSNVYKRYGYLVNRLRFPLSVISSFYALSLLIILVLSLLILVLVAWLLGVMPSIYLLQVPLIVVLMYLFFVFWSLMTSPLSAISKDFANLIRILNLPIFWLSGVIFNVENLEIPIAQTVLQYNPVTFFVTAMRGALCDGYWFWDRPELVFPFAGVFLLTVLCALGIYGRVGKEVPDVI
jgi:teichoic acid transport system permease protein